MKIHKDLQQGTMEWLLARLGKLSASNVAPLMAARGLGKTAKTYALELVAERLTQMPKHISMSFAMEQGIEREPDAREIYEQSEGLTVEQVGGIEADGLWFSPDGLVGEDGIIEIKCPQPPKHLANLLGEGIEDYKPQIQFALMVTGRKWCDFISFNPDFSDETAFKVVRIEPDIEYIELMRERIEAFNVIVEHIINNLK